MRSHPPGFGPAALGESGVKGKITNRRQPILYRLCQRPNSSLRGDSNPTIFVILPYYQLDDGIGQRMTDLPVGRRRRSEGRKRMVGEVCTGQLALVNWGGPAAADLGRTSGASKESEGWSLVVCQGDQLNALR